MRARKIKKKIHDNISAPIDHLGTYAGEPKGLDKNLFPAKNALLCDAEAPRSRVLRGVRVKEFNLVRVRVRVRVSVSVRVRVVRARVRVRVMVKVRVMVRVRVIVRVKVRVRVRVRVMVRVGGRVRVRDICC